MAHDYSFRGSIDTTSKLYEAYKTATDVRKFEIELYWKRATYFWTFIGLTFASYGAVLTGKTEGISLSQRSDLLFSVACVGLVFSVAWYFVNRGSKFWQRNWEYQVDILETKALGPLYKTVFSDTNCRFRHLTSAYPFSVSNINHILSLFVVFVFALLSVYANPCLGCNDSCNWSWPKIIVGTLSAMFIAFLFHFGRTSAMKQSGTYDPHAVREAAVEGRYSVRSIRVVD